MTIRPATVFVTWLVLAVVSLVSVIAYYSMKNTKAWQECTARCTEVGRKCVDIEPFIPDKSASCICERKTVMVLPIVVE